MYLIYGFDSKFKKCVYCDNAKRFLDMKKQPYQFISVITGGDESGVKVDNKVIDELLQKLSRESSVGLTMPQIFGPNGEYIGGFDDLRKIKL